MKTKTNNFKKIANLLIENSCYTLEELKSGYKAKASSSWKRGYFAANGFSFLEQQIIINELF